MDVGVYTVIGVTEPIYGPLLGPAEAIVPWTIETDPSRDNRTNWILPIVARMGEGVSVAEAQRELERISAGLRDESPKQAVGAMPLVVPLHEATVAGVRPALIVLIGATGIILLIAVSNIANLFLTRGSAREAEFSMRAALGASRMRLVRFRLTESLLLSLLGGMTGVIVAYAGVRFLLLISPAWIPRLDEIALDGTAITAALTATIGSGLLFGLAPEFFLRKALMSRSRDHAVGVAGSGAAWLRSGLVVAQLTLSLVLLTGSGLMIRSFVALLSVPIGIDYHQTVTLSLGGGSYNLGPSGPERVARLQQYRQVLEHVQAIPGVRGATLTQQCSAQRRRRFGRC